MKTPRVLLLSKQDGWCRNAAHLASAGLNGLHWLSGSRHDPFPRESVPKSDIIISFLSPWIVPRDVLEAADLAINFHPASSHYPGIGCYNFALYEGAREYGAVVHHMAPKVDSGELIEERLFRVWPSDTVESLKLRTMVVMLSMFHDVIGMIAEGHELHRSQEAWKRRPFTRKDLDALGALTPEMDGEEIARRVRATTYPGFPGATLRVGGFDFTAPVPQREPYA